MWLGGSAMGKDSPWPWVTGEPFTYQRWGPNKPNGIAANGRPIWPLYAARLTTGGLWYDFSASESAGSFLVEWDDAGSGAVASASPKRGAIRRWDTRKRDVLLSSDRRTIDAKDRRDGIGFRFVLAPVSQ